MEKHDGSRIELPQPPTFESVEDFARWLESIQATTSNGAITNLKWRPAQAAANAIRALNYPNTNDVPDAELREQLSACREDWQLICDAIEKGKHFNPDEIADRLSRITEATMSVVDQAMVDRAYARLLEIGTTGMYSIKSNTKAFLLEILKAAKGDRHE